MIKCIVIDDEQPAIDIMKYHIGKISELELIGTFQNPIEGLKHIKSQKPDVVFLDIQMSEMTGLDVMNIVGDDVKIILCTAFSEYAVEGFNNNAVDYLLKPVSFERFDKAVKKIIIDLQKTRPPKDCIYVKTEQKGKFIKIYYNEIDYIEAMGNYISINRGKERVVAYSTMKDVEQTLPSDLFIRIHKSYIISFSQISMIENGFVVLKNGTRLSIGLNYKNNLMKNMKTNLL